MLYINDFFKYGEEFFFKPLETNFPISLWHYGRSNIISHNYSFNGMERGDSEFAIFQYTVSGRGGLIYQDLNYSLNPGEALLLTVPHNHMYFLPQDSKHWDFIYVALRGKEAIRIWKIIQERSGPVVRIPDSSPFWISVKNLCGLKRRNSNLTGFDLASFSYTFVMALQKEIWSTSIPNKTRPSFIEKVINYCVSNIQKEILVEQMAQVSGLSKHHFSRVFYKYVGESPASYLKQMRLDFSINLLQTTNNSIKEIAFLCGFADQGYFCKIFKKKYGLTPREFRISPQYVDL